MNMNNEGTVAAQREYPDPESVQETHVAALEYSRDQVSAAKGQVFRLLEDIRGAEDSEKTTSAGNIPRAVRSLSETLNQVPSEIGEELETLNRHLAEIRSLLRV